MNKSLDYMRVGIFSAGVDWRLRDRLIVSVEGFYKRYGDVPLSVAGRDTALVQGQRLRRGGQRGAGLLGAGTPTAWRRWPAGRFRGA